MKTWLRLPDAISACLFDLDGVLTRTAEVHAAAWKQTFDDLLQRRAASGLGVMVPFDKSRDYDAFIDGRPRSDGVRVFLASRGITLAEGSPAEPGSPDTVYGVGRRKYQLVQELLAKHGVVAYEGSLRFLAVVRAAGLRQAVVTSSESADAVLHAAGLDGAFDVQVDGALARQLGLAGKPAPAVFQEAARRLGVDPGDAAVFEDAVAGVAAGRAGRFGLVVGVDRGGRRAALRAAGADVVVEDLVELIGEA